MNSKCYNCCKFVKFSSWDGMVPESWEGGDPDAPNPPKKLEICLLIYLFFVVIIPNNN